jgi:predicted nucleic acid-binding protein
MKVFGDTSFYLALLSPSDTDHAKAVELSRRDDFNVLTTGFALLELGNTLSRPEDRPRFLALLTALRGDPTTLIVAPDQPLLDAGLALFADRPDKSWSLTDCMSFVVMTRHQLTNALTADHHFEQAGFIALLK